MTARHGGDDPAAPDAVMVGAGFAWLYMLHSRRRGRALARMRRWAEASC